MLTFSKSFTQQEALSGQAIARAVSVMQSGRLHRYNVDPGELSEAALLEKEFAQYQGVDYCVACTSGGYAINLALRSAGVKPGDNILANAYTLAPVPGAIHNAGGVPVFVEIDRNYHIDLNDLETRARRGEAQFLLLSHMRGHIADMREVARICSENRIMLIEDCAHTMGARWDDVPSGNFGRVACFSTQSYKHINSGEGGLLTTNDAAIAARAVIHSGSYMLYERHGAAPEPHEFEAVKYVTANYSGRLDNLRAAIIREQLNGLDNNCRRWNQLYDLLFARLSATAGIEIPPRDKRESYVGSSIQFRPESLDAGRLPGFLKYCGQRGVELKWFGEDQPRGYTSRYDSWRYIDSLPNLPKTLDALEKTCDMRIPLTFDRDDCATIAQIIGEVLNDMTGGRSGSGKAV